MPQREQHFFVVANGMANVAVGGVIIRVILLTRSIQEGKKGTHSLVSNYTSVTQETHCI